MTQALYRRYRPEKFAEVIGQEHVTGPLQAALASGRVSHAYLFSGPRGCGKTTSARILARCLNCEAGPTPEPCGQCASCQELGRGGGGSLDVLEIDAASHNGVDDARDLRERAVYAPVRDRYKIFILDEAHMVTTQGFNALLKLVEEPPAHVKFVFATTEPEKVIGTIRSRTHHYPFRLVAPGTMLDYMASLCEAESISPEPGVLALVVRAGGGSVRDSESVLDQLMAGSQGGVLTYSGAVALLGYTPENLLAAMVDALASADGGAAFRVIDSVVESGGDPRRFAEDFLERLRDLIVFAAAGDGALAALRSVPPDAVEGMRSQASRLGLASLTRAADAVNLGLTQMTGATSPRLQLELLVARMLVQAAGPAARGAAPAGGVGVGGGGVGGVVGGGAGSVAGPQGAGRARGAQGAGGGGGAGGGAGPQAAGGGGGVSGAGGAGGVVGAQGVGGVGSAGGAGSPQGASAIGVGGDKGPHGVGSVGAGGAGSVTGSQGTWAVGAGDSAASGTPAGGGPAPLASVAGPGGTGGPAPDVAGPPEPDESSGSPYPPGHDAGWGSGGVTARPEAASPPGADADTWPRILARLRGPIASIMRNNATLDRIDHDTAVFVFDASGPLEFFRRDHSQERLTQAAAATLGRPLTFKGHLASAGSPRHPEPAGSPNPPDAPPYSGPPPASGSAPIAATMPPSAPPTSGASGPAPHSVQGAPWGPSGAPQPAESEWSDTDPVPPPTEPTRPADPMPQADATQPSRGAAPSAPGTPHPGAPPPGGPASSAAGAPPPGTQPPGAPPARGLAPSDSGTRPPGTQPPGAPSARGLASSAAGAPPPGGAAPSDPWTSPPSGPAPSGPGTPGSRTPPPGTPPPSGMDQDITSTEDPDAEEAGLIGAPLLIQELGGEVISETTTPPRG